MKLFIDSADVEQIRHIYEYFPVDGVTTNPSILSKAERDPYDVLKEIREIIGPKGDLFVQAVSKDADEILKEAHRIISELGDNTIIKIPCDPEGYKAMKLLRKENIRFIGTVVYTPMQGYLAAKAGAEYVAPYVNRIDNMGFDGIRVAEEIHDIISKNGYSCKVLAASFKNSQQILALAKYGEMAATAAPEVIELLIKNVAIDDAIEKFAEDFENITAPGKDMSNI